MRVEHQGYLECALASLAAVAGLPLETVREEACRVADVEAWADVMDKHEVYWKALRVVARRVGLLPLVDEMRLLCRTGPTGASALPPGRGIAVVNKYPTTHAMPFEDGMVIDPSVQTPMPETLESWLARHPGWVYKGASLANKEKE